MQACCLPIHGPRYISDPTVPGPRRSTVSPSHHRKAQLGRQWTAISSSSVPCKSAIQLLMHADGRRSSSGSSSRAIGQLRAACKLSHPQWFHIAVNDGRSTSLPSISSDSTRAVYSEHDCLQILIHGQAIWVILARMQRWAFSALAALLAPGHRCLPA